jgi:hypothetical protein
MRNGLEAGQAVDHLIGQTDAARLRVISSLGVGFIMELIRVYATTTTWSI